MAEDHVGLIKIIVHICIFISVTDSAPEKHEE